MREITTTEEMLACNEAIRQEVRQFPESTWDPEEEYDHAVLRQMWMAGRDWQRAETERQARERSRLTSREDDRGEGAM